MSLDELLARIRLYRLLLISESEIWPSPFVTQELHKAMRKHRKGLRVLLRWSDIRTCASPTWHRPYWKHCGEQVYTCDVCRRIAV